MGVLTELVRQRETETEAEPKYRRGYIHGVHEMIAAVEPHLSEAQLMKLRQWATGELFEWSRGSGEFLPPPAPKL